MLYALPLKFGATAYVTHHVVNDVRVELGTTPLEAPVVYEYIRSPGRLKFVLRRDGSAY